jgi:hypothetical protein
MGAITAAILRGTGAVETELAIMLIAAAVLFGSFSVLREQSLNIAVWAVPLAYLVRFILLVAAIKSRLELRIADLLHTFRGPLVLAVTGVSVAALIHSSPQASSIGMGTVPPLAGCCSIALLLMTRYTWFLGTPLSTMIREKFSTGRLGPTLAWLERGRH